MSTTYSTNNTTLPTENKKINNNQKMSIVDNSSTQTYNRPILSHMTNDNDEDGVIIHCRRPRNKNILEEQQASQQMDENMLASFVVVTETERQQLSVPLVKHIFSFLTAYDVIFLRGTCKAFYKASQDKLISIAQRLLDNIQEQPSVDWKQIQTVAQYVSKASVSISTVAGIATLLIRLPWLPVPLIIPAAAARFLFGGKSPSHMRYIIGGLALWTVPHVIPHIPLALGVAMGSSSPLVLGAILSTVFSNLHKIKQTVGHKTTMNTASQLYSAANRTTESTQYLDALVEMPTYETMEYTGFIWRLYSQLIIIQSNIVNVFRGDDGYNAVSCRYLIQVKITCQSLDPEKSDRNQSLSYEMVRKFTEFRDLFEILHYEIPSFKTLGLQFPDKTGIYGYLVPQNYVDQVVSSRRQFFEKMLRELIRPSNDLLFHPAVMDFFELEMRPDGVLNQRTQHSDFDEDAARRAFSPLLEDDLDGQDSDTD
eukprot:gb/GECH01013882.1/.p1 GENE.gb/GECH01013882.1/~~gb/GECH01013882.1/.p1  ORF type:complete len:482 (+),score=113.98 gb/GECH01013882.1/:1-1446(+)